MPGDNVANFISVECVAIGFAKPGNGFLLSVEDFDKDISSLPGRVGVNIDGFAGRFLPL